MRFTLLFVVAALAAAPAAAGELPTTAICRNTCIAPSWNGPRVCLQTCFDDAGTIRQPPEPLPVPGECGDGRCQLGYEDDVTCPRDCACLPQFAWASRTVRVALFDGRVVAEASRGETVLGPGALACAAEP